MPSSPSDPAPEDLLTRRAADLESLRQAEHDTAFAGDQREVTGESSTVSQHPADTADFTYERALQQGTQHLLEREAAQIEAALRARAGRELWRVRDVWTADSSRALARPT